MSVPADGIETSPQRDQHQDGAGQVLARRHVLQIAGGTLLGGVAATVLNACSRPNDATNAAASGGTTPAGNAGSGTSSSGAPSALPSTTGAQAVAVDGTLPIPPLLTAEDQGGTRVFRLAAQKGVSHFQPGQTTTTYGFNGNYLGPTLRAGRSDRVQIHVTNNLGEATTVHWHGMHLPAAMDGGPHQMIADNTTWSPQFTIQQPGATLWYHPHVMGQTLRQVGMGLVGLFILDDTDQNDLPRTYGVDDIPLILQAKTFAANGQFVLNGGGGGRGRGGGGGGQAKTLVNGAISPTINTHAARLRFRLLNASSQEFYNLGFANGETFHQVASDGGLLPAPVALTQLQLAPAERAEIVVDIDPNKPMVLQGFGGNGGGRGGTAFQGGSLLTINPTQTSAAPAPLPATLATIERLQTSSATQTRDFVLGGDDDNPTINGQAMTTMADMMNMAEVFQVKLGTTEIWNIINRSNDTHAFHVHDIQFQIVQRNGAAPAANEAGLKDTVVVRQRETVRLIMRFDDYADPNTPYMYHCHLLNHEDNGMMGQFVVV